MRGTGLPEADSEPPDGPRHDVSGAWVGYLIFALILLFLSVLDAQFADEREWRSFIGTTVFAVAFLIIPTGGARWLRRSWQARKPPARS